MRPIGFILLLNLFLIGILHLVWSDIFCGTILVNLWYSHFPSMSALCCFLRSSFCLQEHLLSRSWDDRWEWVRVSSPEAWWWLRLSPIEEAGRAGRPDVTDWQTQIVSWPPACSVVTSHSLLPEMLCTILLPKGGVNICVKRKENKRTENCNNITCEWQGREIQ